MKKIRGSLTLDPDQPPKEGGNQDPAQLEPTKEEEEIP